MNGEESKTVETSGSSSSITMKNSTPILSLSTIMNTASKLRGVTEELETQLRIYSCELIQDLGILLSLPQLVIAHAQALFHRFYMKRSMTEFDIRYSVIACVFLSAKLNEKTKKLQIVIEAFDYLLSNVKKEEDYLSLSSQNLSSAVTSSTDMSQLLNAPILTMRNEVIRVERFICTDLGFVLNNVEFPHTYILFFLHILEASDELIQCAWNYCNDAFRCRVLCLHVKPHVLACGSIYMAAKRLNIKLPENPGWWLLFETTLDNILLVEKYLKELYEKPKSKYVHVLSPNLPTLYRPEPVFKVSTLESISSTSRSHYREESRERDHYYRDRDRRSYYRHSKDYRSSSSISRKESHRYKRNRSPPR
jgi:hypothetical protein